MVATRAVDSMKLKSRHPKTMTAPVHDCPTNLRRRTGQGRRGKLRFFVGLSERETAEALGISERTVERHWAYAKVWLLQAIRTQGAN
jgi:FixJ family two-component response regulator